MNIPAADAKIPHPATYEIEVRRTDEGYIGSIEGYFGGVVWSSRPFKSSAAAWRTLLREVARRQGLT